MQDGGSAISAILKRHLGRDPAGIVQQYVRLPLPFLSELLRGAHKLKVSHPVYRRLPNWVLLSKGYLTDLMKLRALCEMCQLSIRHVAQALASHHMDIVMIPGVDRAAYLVTFMRWDPESRGNVYAVQFQLARNLTIP